MPAAPEQLEQVVSHTNQVPLWPHLSQAAQEESSEAATLFDLTEDRLYTFLAFGVGRPPAHGPQFAPHPVFLRRVFWNSPPGRGRLLAVLSLPGRDVPVHLFLFQIIQIGFAEVSRNQR